MTIAVQAALWAVWTSLRSPAGNARWVAHAVQARRPVALVRRIAAGEAVRRLTLRGWG